MTKSYSPPKFLISLMVCAILLGSSAMLTSVHAYEGRAECKITELTVTASDCDADGKFTMTIDFVVEHPGNSGFKAWNGAFYGEFDYSDLPITIGPFSGDCHTSWAIHVKDLEDPHCFAAAEIGKVCCNNDPGEKCKIKDLTVTHGDCNEDDQFYVTIDFNVENPGNEGFKIVGNGHHYGDFDYGYQPITLGPFDADCATKYEFAVKDLEDPHCHAAVNLGKICCNGEPGDKCKIKDLVAIAGECDDHGKFFVTLDFMVENPGNHGFKVYGNGHHYGEFEYADLPITLGPLSGDCKTEWEFAVKDLGDPHCFAAVGIGKKCCNGGGDPSDCAIKEASVKVECDGDTVFFAVINFDVVHPGSLGFSINGNGHDYGDFDYADLPIILGPLLADCHTHYFFFIEDNEKEKCHKELVVGKVCCGHEEKCEIKSLHASVGDCTTDSTYLITVDFDLKNGEPGYFDLWINGHYYGEYHTDDLPLTLEVLGGKNAKDMVKVCMKGPKNCCAIIHYHAPTCLHNGKEIAHSFKPYDKDNNENNQYREGDIGTFTLHISGRPITLMPTQAWREMEEVTITDISGHPVYNARTPGNHVGVLHVDRNIAWQPGIYVIAIRTNQGLETFKVFIARD